MIEIELTRRPKNPIIIEGFPGFGLVGTITTEYLIAHLKTELIGKFWLEDMPAAVAIHQGKLIPPIEIHYSKRYNLVIVHALASPNGMEWKMADMMGELVSELKAKEIISLEGIAGDGESNDTYFYSTRAKPTEKLKSVAKPIEESIVLGVTGALLLKEKKTPINAFFVETASNLPDSKAAASMVKLLDKYLGLDVDPKPLLKTAKEFEKKLKGIMENSKKATEERDSKRLDYFG
ncbi:MAG: proteasome assembly chaperone family protein [Candidatus Woesearchaeota archaeon]